jgi:hypothetical protein
MKSPSARHDTQRTAGASRSRLLTALSLVMALAIPSAVSAQTASHHIYKCVQGEMVAYQSMPCDAGQTEARVLTMARAQADVPAPSTAVPQIAPADPSAQPASKVWPPRRTLMLGMSDDEVLNLAGWGVPQHIARTRAARGWREEWTYATSAGDRRLYFDNARLVDAIVDGDARQAMAQVETARRSYPAS